MVETVNWPPSAESAKMASPPILAVRPFMGERSQQWCGEMSLPSFYRKPDPARRHSLPSDRLATREPGDQGGRSQSRDFRIAVPLPRWTSFRGNSWQQELDAVRYLLDIDENKWDAIDRRLGSVVSCRTECISPESPLKTIPKQGFSPTIYDREVKTRAESEMNQQQSLTRKTVRVREQPRQTPINLRGQRVKTTFGSGAPSPPGLYAKKSPVRAATTQALEDFYRQLVSSYQYEQSHSDFSPAPTIIISRAGAGDERFPGSASAADSRSAFEILKGHGQRTAVEKTLERDFEMLSRKESGEGASPGSVATVAQARMLRPSNGSRTHGELFIRLHQDQNRGRAYGPRWHRNAASVLGDTPTAIRVPLGCRDVPGERRDARQILLPDILS